MTKRDSQAFSETVADRIPKMSRLTATEIMGAALPLASGLPLR